MSEEIAVGTELFYKLRQGWSKVTITGSSRTHWHVGRTNWRDNKPYLISKKDLLCYFQGRGYSATQMFTQQGMRDRIWLSRHRHRIAQLVESTDDVSALQRAAHALGYNEDEAK